MCSLALSTSHTSVIQHVQSDCVLCAVQANSRAVIVIVTSLVLIDIGVSISLEPNAPEDREQTSFEIFAYWLDVS